MTPFSQSHNPCHPERSEGSVVRRKRQELAQHACRLGFAEGAGGVRASKHTARAALLLTLCWISLFSSAQSTRPDNCPMLRQRQPIKVHSIRGVVADESGGLIGEVKVTLLKVEKDDQLEDVASQWTNNVGRFEFSTPAAGKYRLGFQHRGFYFATVPIELTKAGWDALRLTMAVAPSDTYGECHDKYKIEELSNSSFRQKSP
jgi:5-hydroxyisourate hydrolase-like protein (transthyretin family)